MLRQWPPLCYWIAQLGWPSRFTQACLDSDFHCTNDWHLPNMCVYVKVTLPLTIPTVQCNRSSIWYHLFLLQQNGHFFQKLGGKRWKWSINKAEQIRCNFHANKNFITKALHLDNVLCFILIASLMTMSLQMLWPFAQTRFNVSQPTSNKATPTNSYTAQWPNLQPPIPHTLWHPLPHSIFCNTAGHRVTPPMVSIMYIKRWPLHPQICQWNHNHVEYCLLLHISA